MTVLDISGYSNLIGAYQVADASYKLVSCLIGSAPYQLWRMNDHCNQFMLTISVIIESIILHNKYDSNYRIHNTCSGMVTSETSPKTRTSLPLFGGVKMEYWVLTVL